MCVFLSLHIHFRHSERSTCYAFRNLSNAVIRPEIHPTLAAVSSYLRSENPFFFGLHFPGIGMPLLSLRHHCTDRRANRKFWVVIESFLHWLRRRQSEGVCVCASVCNNIKHQRTNIVEAYQHCCPIDRDNNFKRRTAAPRSDDLGP